MRLIFYEWTLLVRVCDIVRQTMTGLRECILLCYTVPYNQSTEFVAFSLPAAAYTLSAQGLYREYDVTVSVQ